MSETSWFETRCLARLQSLGFMRQQVVRCRTGYDAKLYVPARVNGEAAQLIFSGGMFSDCHLYQSYAADKGLSVVNDKTLIDELSALGRTVTRARATVQGEFRGGDPPIAGFLNSRFFKDGIVAIDASVPVIAFATDRDQLSLADPVGRLALDGNNMVAIPSGAFAVAYQMSSLVAQRFLGKERPPRNGRAEVTLSLTGAITVSQSVEVRAESAVDGILGADLLCRWITVFDFPAGELLLFPYD